MASKAPLLQRLLLLPLLAPLLGCLAVAAINPRPSVALRFLTWRTPALPLGAWIAAAAGAGAGLSGMATALALRQEVRQRTRRRLSVESGRPQRRTEPRRQSPPPAADTFSAGPARSAGEPPPTVSVPFRVIQRGRPASHATGSSSVASGAASTAASSGGAPLDDDWSAPPADDW